MKRPIVIEFSGLPNSGKTTLVQNLNDLCHKRGIITTSVQEPAELLPKCITKGSIEQNLWITLETLQRSLELTFESGTDFIFLDRGFYNQLFLVTLYESKDPSYTMFVTDIMNKFGTIYNAKPDYLYIIDVDVDESIKRRMATGEPVTFSKKDFLVNYKVKFEKFAETIDSKLYLNTTNMSKNEVAETVFDQIMTLMK